MGITIDKILKGPLMHKHKAADLPPALGAASAGVGIDLTGGVFSNIDRGSAEVAVHELAYDHLLIATALQSELDPVWTAEKPDYSTTAEADALYAPISVTNYTLPTASAVVLGGIKVGTRLSILDGVLSANATDLSAYSTKLQADALYAPITITQYTDAMAVSAVGTPWTSAGYYVGDGSAFATALHNHDLAYLGITAKASDSDKLDGHDTAYFEVAGAGASAVSGHELAYNHSLIASALQSETDPVFTAWDKSTGISITKSQVSDFGTYSTDIHSNITALDAVTGVNTGDQNLTGYVPYTGGTQDVVLTDKSFWAGTETSASPAKFHAAELITTHAHYAFIDTAVIEYGQTGFQAHASYNAAVTIQGAEDSDHHHCYQSTPFYKGTGTLNSLSSFYSQPYIYSGTIDKLKNFRVLNPTYVGGTVNKNYGLYIEPLNKATDNFGIYVEYNKCFFGGTLGVNAETPMKAVEINHVTGQNLRLTYNASANYADFLMSSGGNLTIAPSGGTTAVTGHVTLEGVTSTGATGTGKLVFDTSPTLVTPVIGAATGTSLTATGSVQGDNLISHAKGQIIDMMFNAAGTKSNIKGMWFFDQTAASTAITDRSTAGHDLVLSANGSTLTPGVTGLGRNLTIAGPTSFYETADHDDFSIGDGSTPVACTIIWAGTITDMTNCSLWDKYDGTTGSIKAEYYFVTVGEILRWVVFNGGSNSALIGRSYNAALTADENTPHVYVATYSGGTTPAACKVYRDGVQIDDTNISAGTFVAPSNTTVKPSSYFIAADGTTKSYPQKSKPVFQKFVKGEAYDAATIKQLSQALLGYMNNLG